MSKILLIGGAGYIGTVISHYFLKKGFKVSCIDNLIYKHRLGVETLIFNQSFDFHLLNFNDTSKLKEIAEDASSCIFLGGLVGDPITKKYPELSITINEHSILKALNALNETGLKRLIFISTCSNYGMQKHDELATEETELNPLSLYAKSKVKIEKFILENCGSFSFCPTILRFATAFGLSPRMRFDLTVNEFARTLMIDKKLEVFDAHTWRPYCHVNDFARLIDITLAAETSIVEGQVFNAGGAINNHTKLSVVEAIKKYVPDTEITYVENGNDPRNYRVDFGKVEKKLNFTPSYTIDYGIKQIIEALNQGFYHNIDNNIEQYGNYQIEKFK